MEIKQNWIVNIVKENPTFPFIVIDNWYTPSEEKAIWKELDYYSSPPKEHIDRAENTIVARYSDGTAKSKAFRWYLNNFYTIDGLKKSAIFNCMYKVRTPHDHYDSHHDTFLWTQCTWFVREPRLFTGGDFDFPESGFEIKLKHNRTVFFPCCFLHRVSPVKFHTQPKEIGFGRYTITHFYYSIPIG